MRAALATLATLTALQSAAAVAADAKASGLNSIDHVAKTNTPNGQTLLVAWISTWLMTFGTTWRNTARRLDAPSASTASI